ncbi:hypothetical protein [Nocardioides sp. W7]|uniref:hypothetical protein n=1 Tax=Nocardioides sp. W7 TaxID=2931390 RepID=UPI001FD30EB3|nr:hypothetical protein [Nocardioides sp. W7]
MHRRVTSPRAVRSVWSRVGLLAALACLGWVPFMGRTLSPDEGGMLIVGGQWAPGSSLYGDYWVDRPPVLVALFALADGAGGAWALRTMGVLAVLASVALAGLVGRLAVPSSRSAPLLTAGAAAALVATPLFGGGAVNGELLGLPFLLAGIAAVLRSRMATSWRGGFGWALLAGVAGACGAMVKQNLVDVFVLLAALVVLQWRPRRGESTVGSRTLAGSVVGALAAVGVAVSLAALRGTDPGPLWEAVVSFRGEAAAKIVSAATETTTRRLLGMIGALLASGAPFLIAALILATRRPVREAGDSPGPGDLRWPALAVLSWELLAAYVSGSYWLHYLTALVPGVVLVAAAAAQRRPRRTRLLTTAYAVTAISTAIAIAFVAVRPMERPEEPVISYLQDKVRPGDTGMVAFGAANILQASGLRSPYPDLWSLPVRVRDPRLERLAGVLAGPERPTWLVVAGRSLDTWGIDASAAQGHVDQHYELVGSPGRFTVYHRKDHTP